MSARDNGLGRWQRGYVALAAFLSGASMMVLELVASRVLAPVFGNTVFLWTCVIGIILAALSVGYWLGGELADRRPGLAALSTAFTAAGLAVALVPMLSTGGARMVGQGLRPGRRTPDSRAAIVLRPIPALRSDLSHCGEARSQRRIKGRTRGRSRVGAVCAGKHSRHVLCRVHPHPHGGKPQHSLGCCRDFNRPRSTRVFLQKRRPAKSMVAAVVVIVALSAGEPAVDANDHSVVFDKQTFYHRIRVKDQSFGNRTLRLLMLDTTDEGAMFLNDPEMPFVYTRYIDVADLFVKNPLSALFIGGGAYSMPKHFVDKHEKGFAHVFELDPEVAAVGRRFFDLERFDRITNRTGDARRLLRQTSDRYDVIFGDAYNGIRWIPFHLATREYFDLVRAHLTDQGVYMTNIISSVDGEGSSFFRATASTLRTIFPEIYVFATGSDPRHPQNLILVCPAQARRLSPEDVERAGNELGMASLTQSIVAPAVYQSALSDSRVITDDYAPVEMLVSAGR
jgi:spermidine synthase